MDSIAEIKTMRLLAMYDRLINGRVLRKLELAQEFGVTQRSIQRDLETLRVFFADELMGRELIYDNRERGYRLSTAEGKSMSDSEILAVCKILLAIRGKHGKLSERPDFSRGETGTAFNPDIALRENQFPKN